jgi:oxalyl-CoA decarboxylase
VFNNNGIYKGTDVNPRGRRDGAHAVRQERRYDQMMQAFGGVGVVAKNPRNSIAR